ncbi:MAG: sigma-70 family RNA polymerase sigma factor, partial [Phycisphaerae bacterium]|nr:sigma-70 family RNA polymerase sigma factor [Phycisphaerae bacterium]
TGGFDHDLAELVAEGNLVLLETVETFDPGRGNRFSTYLTWALMRRFADATRRLRPMPTLPSDLGGEYWPAGLNPNVAALEHTEAVDHALGRLLEHLDDRERFIVTRHFGIGTEADTGEAGAPGEPQTLAQVAAALDITPERARQIEHRALGRLRQTARELGLELPGSAEGPSRPAGR